MMQMIFMTTVLILNFILIISIVSLIGDKVLGSLFGTNTTSEKMPQHFDLAQNDQQAIQAPGIDNRVVVINRVKRALNKNKALDQSDIDVTENYTFDHLNPPHEKFANWATDQNACVDLCNFGVRLLERKADAKCLLIVTDILKRINGVSNTLGTFSAIAINHLLKLMVAYEYIAIDEFTKQLICHKLINEIAPSLGATLNGAIKPEKMVFLGIPRLLTNFLYNPEVFETDIKSSDFKTLDSYFNIKYNTSDKIQNGVYMDGSSIETKNGKNVASYAVFKIIAEIMEDNFYFDMFKALGFNSNSRQIAKAILEKLLHPSIPFHTVGLFNEKSNKIKDLNLAKIKAHKNGVFVFPLIGVGVFKTPQSIFTIRVQKKNITTTVKNKLTLALMQLRNIYVKSETIPEFSKFDDMINRTGVILDENQNTSLDDDNTDAYAISGAKSYIGNLLDVPVLFWINHYTVSKLYECTVVEIGVMTDGGLSLAYNIMAGNIESKRLSIGTPDNSGQSITKSPQKFKFQVGQDQSKIAVNLQFGIDTNSLMGFKYQKNTYEIVSIDETSFVVKRNGKVILGGKESSSPYDYIYYDNQILRRLSGPMYEPFEM